MISVDSDVRGTIRDALTSASNKNRADSAPAVAGSSALSDVGSTCPPLDLQHRLDFSPPRVLRRALIGMHLTVSRAFLTSRQHRHAIVSWGRRFIQCCFPGTVENLYAPDLTPRIHNPRCTDQPRSCPPSRLAPIRARAGPPLRLKVADREAGEFPLQFPPPPL